MKRPFLILLCAIFGYVLPGQNLLRDSLEHKIAQGQLDGEALIDALNELSFQYLNSDPGKGLEMINQSILLSDSFNYKAGKVWALLNKGNAYWFSGLYDEALDWFYRAGSLNQNENLNADMAIANNIAEVFKRKGQYDSALSYYRDSWRIISSNDLKEPRPLVAYNLGELFKMTNNLDSSAKYFDMAYDEAKKVKTERYLAYALFGKGDLAAMRGEEEASLSLHQESLEIRKRIDDLPGAIQSLHRIATILVDQKRYNSAEDLLNEAEVLARQINGLDYLSNTYFEKSKLFEKQRSFEQANTYLKEYHALKDSLESTSFALRSEKIKEALLSEIRQKEFQLSEQERANQQKEIRQQTWVIAFVSFLVLVLSAYFFNYRRGLRLARSQSKALNELNNIILAKNKEIEEINKHLDHKLIKVTKLLSESQKIAKLGSWEYNCETKEYHWTDETYRQLGLTPQKAIPTNKLFEELVPPEDYKRLERALKRTREQGVISDENFRLHLKTGEEKFIRIRYFPEIVRGKLVRVYGSNQDVTQLVLTEYHEKAIIRSLLELSRFANLNKYNFEHFLDYLLKQSTQTLRVERAIFWLFEKQNKRLVCFKSYCVNKKETEEIQPIYLDEYPEYLAAIMDNRTLPVSDVRKSVPTASLNSKFLAPYDIKSLLDAKVQIDGEMVGLFSMGHYDEKDWTFSEQRYVGSLTDIIATAYSTNQNKKLENEKGELINKLFKKSQNLEELAYVVSHNLRGPVTQIMGLAELYKDPQSKELQEDIVYRIAESSKELDKVIKDLSEILKQQEEETELVEEIVFKTTIHDMLKQVKSEWPDLDYKLNLSIEEGFSIQGKRSQINNIVYTLLSNSFKYRQLNKTLELSVNAKRTPYALQISFADNGLGIDLGKYESKVFRMYQRFHPEIEGTGIGLFIVKNQVEAMGGSIEVTSDIFQGTIFTIELPHQAPRSVSALRLENAL